MEEATRIKMIPNSKGSNWNSLVDGKIWVKVLEASTNWPEFVLDCFGLFPRCLLFMVLTTGMEAPYPWGYMRTGVVVILWVMVHLLDVFATSKFDMWSVYCYFTCMCFFICNWQQLAVYILQLNASLFTRLKYIHTILIIYCMYNACCTVTDI